MTGVCDGASCERNNIIGVDGARKLDSSGAVVPVTVAMRSIRNGFSYVVSSCSEGAGS